MAKQDYFYPPIDDAPLSRTWSFDLPAEFVEPEGSPIAPTPILNIMNPWCEEATRRDRARKEAFAPLFDPHNAPALVPSKVADMIMLNQLTGEAHRLTNALAAYTAWNADMPSLETWTPEQKEYARLQSIRAEVADKGLDEAHEALLQGTLTPSEGLALLRHTQLTACELAMVVHPYGYRMEYVKDERAQVLAAIAQHHGVVAPVRREPYQKITFQPHFEYHRGSRAATLGGLLVTYKRPIGHILDENERRIKVIERQSAAIRVDPQAADLLPSLARLLRAPLPISASDGSVSLDELRHQTMYEDYFGYAIQGDPDVDYLIPLSTMTYGARETEVEYEDRLRGEEALARKLGDAGLTR